MAGAAAHDSAGNSSRPGAAANSPAAGSGGQTGAAANPPAAGSSGRGAADEATNSPAAESGGHTSAGAGANSPAATGGSESTRPSSGTSAAQGCNAPDLLFCDDFEAQGSPDMPPPAPWTIANNGMGHSVVDMETPAHSGKASVKVTSEGGYQTFFALTGAPAFPHDGALYLRIYLRLDAPMTSGHNTYFKAGASGATSSDHETRMGVMNGMLMINQPAGDRGFLSNEDYYRDGNMPGVVFAPMTWVCVETFFDPANKTIEVWVHGTEIPDLHRNDWEQDPIGALHFGFEKYAGPDATLWYDDIALSTQPIGCHQ